MKVRIILLSFLTVGMIGVYASGPLQGLQAANQTMPANGIVAAPTLQDTDPSGLQSDDFSGATLSPFWSRFDPIGDQEGKAPATIILQNGNAVVNVPAGDRREPWTAGNNAVRIMQQVAIGSADFGVEVKFNSRPQSVVGTNNMQGILVQQSATRFLRFDFNNEGDQLRIFAAGLNNNTMINGTNRLIEVNGNAPMYLRLIREGNNWKLSYSFNGTAFTSVGDDISFALNVTSIGVYAGTSASGNNIPPAYTARVDYFRNLADTDFEDDPPAQPTAVPTAMPTAEPTAMPTAEPTVMPTAEPTVMPTPQPTAQPTPGPDLESVINIPMVVRNSD